MFAPAEVEANQISTVSQHSLVRTILAELKSLKEADQNTVSCLSETTINTFMRNLQQSLTDIFSQFDKLFDKKFL